MTAEVRVLTEWDPVGLKLQIVHSTGDGGYTVLTFEPIKRLYVPPEEAHSRPPENTELRLHQDEGRALYEALAEHFGHGTHNTESLRRDYNAERARVDKLLDVVTEIARRAVSS